MIKDINHYMTIVRKKNGQVKIIHNEENIYGLLQELGYRKAKLNNKQIYFLREREKVIPLNVEDIKEVFLNLLEKKEFTNIPADIENDDILEWYYKKKPIKANGLFNYYLNDTLTNMEEETFRLETDKDYKRKNEVQQLLSKFDEWGFSKTIDTIGNFCKDNILYYKNISDKKYLVFIYLNSKKIKIDLFDSWIATFADEKHIGIKKSFNRQEIRMGFELERDFELIKDYVD